MRQNFAASMPQYSAKPALSDRAAYHHQLKCDARKERIAGSK